jgi:hypothetical protein
MVEYFKIEEVPDQQYFRCDRYKASLSVSACAKMWKEANHENVEARYRCKTCPLGAVHAGETAASMSPLLGKSICARCHGQTARLIGKHICVSCYNRQREWIIGKNAKGTRPLKIGRLDPRTLRYFSGGQTAVLHAALSATMDELIIAALRDSKNRVRFSFHGAIRGTPNQLRLW